MRHTTCEFSYRDSLLTLSLRSRNRIQANCALFDQPTLIHHEPVVGSDTRHQQPHTPCITVVTSHRFSHLSSGEPDARTSLDDNHNSVTTIGSGEEGGGVGGVYRVYIHPVHQPASGGEERYYPHWHEWMIDVYQEAFVSYRGCSSRFCGQDILKQQQWAFLGGYI